ncbi:hypothetical protein diail_7611 [Diaporthe ilicicola]|nr:hypothetical protein diail_7611 [Diaporthe ilicicola]
MIKRHFDAICIASVHVQWPDDSIWSFDGSWGRASNMSWYHSHTYGGDGRPQECFWLDHRGTLKHDQDRKEEYILADNDFPYKYRDPSKKATEYISWLKASSVDPEDGIPTGSELLEGMRANEVDQYRVPLGVKFHLPSYKRSTYPRNFDSLTLDDFVFNPGKLDWIYNSLVQRVRRGNPVLPILDPNEDIANPDIQLVWEDEFKQAIPRNCLTDWFWDEEGTFIGPSPDWNWKYTDPKQRKGPYRMKEEKWEALDYYGRKRDNRVTEVDGPSETTPSPPLRERHARTLVNDRNPSADHGVAKALCEDPYSVGPSYAHHAERQFCRMTDKTLMPFCDSAAGISTNCFDADAEVPVGETMPIGKRTVYWDAIEEWKDGERTKRPA